MVFTTDQIFMLADVPAELRQSILQAGRRKLVGKLLIKDGCALFERSEDVCAFVEWIREVYNKLFCVTEAAAQERTGYSGPSLSRLRKGDVQKRGDYEYRGEPFSVEGIGWRFDNNGQVMYTEQEIQRLIERRKGREQ